MLETLTDAEIIESAANDPSRFALIFDRHFAAIHRYLVRRVDITLADDLAQETFLIAFRRRSSFDRGHVSARPWLFGIAANLLRHQRRRERRQLRAYALSGVPMPLDPGYEAADQRMDADALGARIALALAVLSHRDREVLLLSAWAELSYEEMAEALRVPVGTVRSRLSRARRHLRELLTRNGQLLDEEPSDEGSDG